MRVVLVVASGVHTGKEIAMAGTQFVIGRDEGCNLRPASPAISKRHCAITIKDEAVFIQDLGSTNGTLVNDVAITGEHKLSKSDRVKVGPLDFTLKFIEGKSDSTPLPESLKTVPAKKNPSSVAMKPTTETKPTLPAKSMTPAAVKPAAKPSSKEDDQDKIAAMLLGMDDDDSSDSPSVPEGSTVMEMPAVNAEGKPIEKKKVVTQADSSDIARDLLSKLTRRPR